jgi:membrane protease YdiL (CAAX protease family)
VTPILFAFSQSSAQYLPNIVTTTNRSALLLTGIAVGMAAGIFEELGWTGFAIPKLRLSYGMLATGLIVGFIWGAWHVLVTVWASGDSSGNFDYDLLLPPMIFYVAVLPAYRVLMVWVYDRTESLLVAMLMHASLTANTVYILMPPVIGVQLASYYFVLAAALWVAVAAVALNQRRSKLGGRPPKDQLPHRGQSPAKLRPSG